MCRKMNGLLQIDTPSEFNFPVSVAILRVWVNRENFESKQYSQNNEEMVNAKIQWA